MNGKPGDHPLTDVLAYDLEIYGTEADDLIRKIAKLCSRRELDIWWDREIHWSKDRDLVLRRARSHYEDLLKRARESGWETNDT